MRAIAIVIAGSLVAASAALGAQARTHATSVAQKAIEAPRPAGVSKQTVGLVQQIACVSPQSCGAYGRWLYAEHAGKWHAVTVPVLPHTGGANLRSIACPAAGRCEVVGMAGAQHLLAVTESSRRWRSTGFALPGNAASIKPPAGPYPFASGVSCPALGTCAVVGHYGAADHTTHALLIVEHGGKWGAVTDVPLPPDASMNFPPPDSQSFAGGILNLASCPSTGSCTTVGTYTRKPNGASYPWRFDEVGGQWVAATTGLQLPAGAATGVDYRGGGSSPFLGFSGLSCPSAGNCTAVGGYVDAHSDFQGAIFTEHGGTWSKGVKAPVPGSAGNNTDPMELLNPLTAVSCATANDCAAVGWFVKGGSETQHGLLLAEHQGKWKASAISMPTGARAPGGVFLTSVACPSRGSCVAVGYYGSHGKTHGLIVRERGGRWGRAVNAALPGGAAPASKSHTFLNSVTCPSARFCVAGGDYADRAGHTQGLLLSLRLR